MNVKHSNPATQAGFTMIPNAVLLDTRLTIGARVMYGYLKHLAWKSRGEEIETPLQEASEDLGCGINQVTRYVKELVEAGLVETRRRGQGRPNTYLIHDPHPSVTDSVIQDDGSITDSVIQESPNLPIPQSLSRQQDQDKSPPIVPHDPMRPKQVDRRPVGDHEFVLAKAVLGVWCQLTGQHLRSKDWVGKIVMRIREYPDSTLEQHQQVIEHALAHPWWRGEPNPSVVYGSGAQFERSVIAAAAAPKGTEGLTPEEIETYGSLWGPGTPYTSLAAAKAYQAQDVLALGVGDGEE